MRLPAEPVRARLEWAARMAAFALLAWALWRALAPGSAPDRVVDSAALRDAAGHAAGDASRLLGEILASDGATHVRVGTGVASPVRDALSAVRHAGGLVRWSGDRAGLWAATAVPERGPGGGVRVAVVGGVRRDEPSGARPGTPSGTPPNPVPSNHAVLRDELGVLDTVSLQAGGATAIITPGRALRLVAPQAEIPLAVAMRDSTPWRALVLARAGWEAKFVMAALEEHGWSVSARLVVAPGAVVTQGGTAGLDRSARSAVPPYDVIVLLDTVSVGPDAAAITRFVRSGGGVVLAGDGALALPAIAPARAGAPTRGPRSDVVVTRDSRPLRALASLRADAVVLERRDPLVAVAARAEGGGRVVQMGYDDTWRWRMEGGATAVADHRAFWARALESAAPERGVLPPAGEGAPRARLVAAWGPMSAAPVGPGGQGDRRWLWPLVALLLVAEWASRRTRRAA